MAKLEKVDRPTRKSEYELRFATASAKRGWIDLAATIRGPSQMHGTSSPAHLLRPRPPTTGCGVSWGPSAEALSATTGGSTNRPSRVTPGSGSTSTATRCSSSRYTHITPTRPNDPIFGVPSMPARDELGRGYVLEVAIWRCVSGATYDAAKPTPCQLASPFYPTAHTGVRERTYPACPPM